MRRRDFLAGTAAALAPALLRSQSQTTRPPNILFILADDLGYGDLGCYGQRRILTPNVDTLAAEGARFTQAYAGSTVCAPSRCTLITGKHTGHCATRGNRHPEIPVPASDPTIAEVLKRAGYRTAHYGKWGLGGPETNSTPTERGFDEFYGFLNHLHAHQAYPDYIWDGRVETMLPKNWFYKKQVYLPDVFTTKTVDFISRPSSQPFFVFLSYTVPHANNELKNIEVPDQGPYAGENWPEVEKNFAASITRMDGGIGRILKQLKQQGADRDTLVIFTSDNGPHKEGGHYPEFFSSRGGLRGLKRDLYEGGIRVPAIARWPGHIAPGSVNSFPWAFWDVLPTLSDIAGVPQPPKGIDGISFRNALTGRPQAVHPHFYWEFHEGGFQQAVRQGDWKLVRQAPKFDLELYDLSNDPGEQTNLAKRHPDRTVQMSRLMVTERIESQWWPTSG